MDNPVKTKWVIDPAHSEVLFKVKHMMITNVKGEFRKFDATLEMSGTDLSTASVHVIINASSIFTNNDDRDNHLKSADFFDVENHKELTFHGSSVQETDEGVYELRGTLTIRGVSK
jgi:polyisoprenoid-binding protein YceI